MMSGNGRGRPSKLTPKSMAVITDTLKRGASFKDAAIKGGVCYDTFRRWMIRGEKEKTGEYHDFYVAVTRAVAVGNTLLVEEIRKHPDWRAKAFLLTCRNPEEYNPKQKIEQKTEHSGRVALEFVDAEFKEGEDEDAGD